MVMLHGGRWKGRQLVLESWIRQMTTPSPTAGDYGNFLWINNVVTTETDFDAVGFKGQFITVLPKENAVVAMTGLLKVDRGLRDAVYINQYRYMVNEYVLAALHGSVAPSQVRMAETALQAELKLSLDSKGVPAPPLSPFDSVIDKSEK
jgi:CubicO group peptidase (beta-lactamase class C family)